MGIRRVLEMVIGALASLALAVSLAEAAQPPAAAPATETTAASERFARTVADAFFVERARSGLRIWTAARFGEFLRNPEGPLVALEDRFPGITPHTIDRATEAALASYDRDFDEGRDAVVAHLVATYNEQYLGRLAAYATSSSGVKLFGFALNHGFASPERLAAPPPTEADFAAFERSLTDAERRALSDMQNRAGDPQLDDVLDGMGSHYSSWLRGYFERKTPQLVRAAQSAAEGYMTSAQQRRSQ